MFKRLKRALVTSFVGAIALGWVFAQGILHFAYIFSTPIAGWLMRREYRGVTEQANTATGFSCTARIGPVLFTSASWIFLTAWLFFKPLEQETTESGSELASSVVRRRNVPPFSKVSRQWPRSSALT
jgi:hypothetical protein